MKGIVFCCSFLVFFLGSCHNYSEKKSIKLRPGKNDLENINRYFIQKDREKIQSYIERKNLSMKESPDGLWYNIITEGTGKYFRENDKLSLNFVCSLLDGTECYNSDNLGPKECIIGKTDIEAGLNEGLRLLKSGGEAIFILPPHLAYGLVGDGKSIPSRAIIVYHIKIKDQD
jgi:FKBP-type peptidyl-prolyl cis-trans isomerase FkpA